MTDRSKNRNADDNIDPLVSAVVEGIEKSLGSRLSGLEHGLSSLEGEIKTLSRRYRALGQRQRELEARMESGARARAASSRSVLPAMQDNTAPDHDHFMPEPDDEVRIRVLLS